MVTTAGDAAHVAREAGAVQKFAEFARLLEILEARWFGEETTLLDPWGRPPVILEVGSYLGGTLAGFRAMWPSAFIVSIDLPDPPERELAAHGAVTITADSHLVTTRGLALAALDGRVPDLVFIDGDHSEVGCRRDVEMYGTLLEHGGVLALHDVAPYFPSAGADPLGPELVWRSLPRWVDGWVRVGADAPALLEGLPGGHLEGLPMFELLGEIIDRGPSGGQPEEWGGIGLAVRR